MFSAVCCCAVCTITICIQNSIQYSHSRQPASILGIVVIFRRTFQTHLRAAPQRILNSDSEAIGLHASLHVMPAVLATHTVWNHPNLLWEFPKQL